MISTSCKLRKQDSVLFSISLIENCGRNHAKLIIDLEKDAQILKIFSNANLSIIRRDVFVEMGTIFA